MNFCALLNLTTRWRGGRGEWGSSFRYSPYPLTHFVGLSLSRGCPHFLAAVYFICCKQNSSPPPPSLTACHSPRQTLGALSVVALQCKAVFHFYFQLFQLSSFFLSLFSSLWLVLHSALKMRFSCCSAQSLSRSSSAWGRGRGRG